ncbi:RFIP5 protein, partial [Sylvietta virens]|nr:RFIP5 protein [Sylvietta virens]
WLPTHVQVTVVRARGLRCKGGAGGKGKAGGSDAYTVIQLGREKYSTSVAEKSGGSPEWREECAFELPPEPGACGGLVLTVMHRALVGMDRFLGQALVPLEPARQRGREPDERWHKLHSKAGKKEKERGEILVSIQFTRNSLTASMFDLSVKDKPRSPFGKLKDKVTGKKKYDLESASAIIPSSMGALDMEDDFELGGKKSKVKGFFLKNKLRKSSLTQSNTSLGSDSTISSASLSLAGNAPEGTKSPSRHGSLSTERSVLPSPKPTHKRAFSDDASQAGPGPEPVSRSSLCINGSHVYGEQPRNPPGSAPLPVPALPRRQDQPLGFTPLHPDPHEVPWGLGGLERAQQRDEPRFIPSPPSLALQEELKVSTKAVTLSNHLGRARMEESNRLESKPAPAAPPVGLPAEPAQDTPAQDSRREDKRAKGGFFHHGGKGQGDRGTPVHASAAGDERSKNSGWFGSKEPKESPQKPRSVEGGVGVQAGGSCPKFPSPVAQLVRELLDAPGSAQARSEQGKCFLALKCLTGKEIFLDPLLASARNHLCWMWGVCSFPQEGVVLVVALRLHRQSWGHWDRNIRNIRIIRNIPSHKVHHWEGAGRMWELCALPAAGGTGVRSGGCYGASLGMALAFPIPGSARGQVGGAWSTLGWWNVPVHGRGGMGWALRSLPAQTSDSDSQETQSPGSGLVSHPRAGFVGEPEGLWSLHPGAFDIRSSVLRLQASMRLQASDGLLQLSSDIRERRVVLSPWAEPPVPGPPVPPPKPPRWFATTGAVGDSEEGEPGGTQRGKQEQWEDSEGPRAEMELPRSRGSSEPSVPAPPSLPTPAAGAAEAGSDWKQPRLSPQIQGATDSAKWETASKQELFPEELSISGLNPPSKLDLGQPASWTALEEQEAAGHPHPRPQRSERGESPSQLELACQDGEGRAGEQPRAPPEEAEQGRTSEEPEGHSAESRIDFKKADFWKPDRAEQRHPQGASALRNPFTLALSPNSPSNPFVEKPPAPLPVQALLPIPWNPAAVQLLSFPWNPAAVQLLSFPWNPAAVQLLPFPWNPAAVQLLSFPWNPAAVQLLPFPWNPAAVQLLPFPWIPHPVKPLSAVQEGSSEGRQQHRASLGSALSNGLERLKMVTTSSAQPAPQPDKTDPKLKQDPAQLDQSAKYYHLTHDELIQLLLQKEGELSKKEEHIQELENYIDQLLVRIMEQSPTLLQIPLGGGQAP